MPDLFLTCVIMAYNLKGVVVSRNIHDESQNKEWVLVETSQGVTPYFVDELKTIPCSEIDFDKFSEKQKHYINQLLDR